jgi:hypothetical protein
MTGRRPVGTAWMRLRNLRICEESCVTNQDGLLYGAHKARYGQ